MHTNSLVKKLLGVDKIAIENVYFEGTENDETFIAKVRPFTRETRRCPLCEKQCPGYDCANTNRRWRSLDFGSMRVYIEACAPRIRCPEHGVIVAKVPWARHDSDYTKGHKYMTVVVNHKTGHLVRGTPLRGRSLSLLGIPEI